MDHIQDHKRKLSQENYNEISNGYHLKFGITVGAPALVQAASSLIQPPAKVSKQAEGDDLGVGYLPVIQETQMGCQASSLSLDQTQLL